jgi:4-amino-4-deoxy-L-arabinose transferase-like glycosyltransferase
MKVALKPSRAFVLTILIVLGLIFVNFIIQIGAEPNYQNMGVDSGTFAYCGQVIHDGGLMYHDCWDNKTPGVYYLNAAAISLGGSTPFAIWLMQAIWLAVAVVIFFFVIKSIWQHTGLAALGAFTLLVYVLYPGIFQGGNFTETYAILPAVLSIGALWLYLGSGRRGWLVVLGVLAASGFLLKPTYIAMGLASAIVVSYLAIRSRDAKRLVINLAILLISAFIPLLLVGLYFLAKGDLGNLWFAAFSHNFTYVSQGISLVSLYATVRMFLVEQPMAALTILLGIGAGAFIYQNKRLIFSFRQPAHDELRHFTPGEMDIPHKRTWLLAAVLLAFLIDLLFLASSGRNFGHYLQVLLPEMVMVMVYLFDYLRHSMKAEHLSHGLQAAILAAVVLVMLSGGIDLVAKEAPSLSVLKSFVSSNPAIYQPNELEQYVINNSTSEDSVLVWAGHPGINFVTQRRSPTRYIFLLHLFNPTPNGVNGFSEFMNELNSDPPELIVVQPNSSVGLPNPANPPETICPGCDTAALEGMLAFKAFMSANYELKFSVWDWVVYQRIN